jgi:LPXTG-motif cell wall-anchored protein
MVLAVLLGLFAFSGTADAGTYISSCGIILDPPVIEVGGQIHIVGAGFEPGGEVEIFIDGELLGVAQVDDNAEGNIDVTFDLPAEFNVDGEYEITAACPDGDVASNVLIVGAGFVTTTTVTTPLPVTGSDSTTSLVQIGVGLVLVGGLVLLLSRRRANTHAAA